MAETQLGPWPVGMNNVFEEYAMPVAKNGSTVALRNAVNVDVDDNGLIERRPGYTKKYAGVATRAGFSCPQGTYFVEGAALKRLNADNSATILFTGVTGDQCSYCYENNVVYFSDGVITKKILASGAVISWGQDTPVAPIISGISGTFGAGTYIGAVTYLSVDGVESGPSDVRSVRLGANSGVKFDALPTPNDPRVAKLRLYLSTPNGDVLYMVAEVASGTSTFSVSGGRLDSGKPLDTWFISKPPAGRIVRHFRGRMYIADATGAIWYTEPFSYDSVQMAESFLQFRKPVTIMEPVLGGIWIVADKTFFYAGTGPSDFAPQTLLEYGAVIGTAQRVPNAEDVMWYSERGAVLATKDGQVNNIQEANIAAENGTSGAAIVRETDGVRQFIASIRGTTVSPLVAQSFFDAEVIRKGP